MLAKTSIFEVPILAWSFLQSFSSFGANLTHFIKHFTFFPIFDSQQVPKFKSFLKKSLFFERIRPRDPSQMKDLKILHPNHCSTAPETLMRPTWWQKTVKNLKNELFQTVFQHFSYQDDFLATWDPSQMKDLKILRRIHLSTALYDRIWPTLCRFKVPNFMFFLFIFSFFQIFMFFPQPPIPYLLCLVRHHQGTDGKHHLPNGKHHLPAVFILNQASP